MQPIVVPPIVVPPVVVLIVEDNVDYAALIRAWLSNQRSPAFAFKSADSVSSAKSILTQGGVDIMLMDLGLLDSEGAATYLAIREKAPHTPIVVISGDSEEEFALELIQRGAEDYVMKSLCTSESLTRTLMHALSRGRVKTPTSPEINTSPGKLVAILGSSGGVGTTTIAALVATEISRAAAEKTLLIDLDPHPGMVASVTGTYPQSSIYDAFDHTFDRNPTLVGNFVTSGGGKLDILGTANHEVPRRLDAQRVAESLNSWRRVYPWIIVDLGRLSAFAQSILMMADDVCLIMDTSLASLRQSQSAIGMLADVGIDRGGVRFIVNQRRSWREMAPADISHVLKIEIAATLPPSQNELERAQFARILPRTGSAFRTRICPVAKSIVQGMGGTRRRHHGVAGTGALSQRSGGFRSTN